MAKSTDVFSKSKRSEVMSRITGKGNASTELEFIKILRKSGITGWRRHLSLPGRPDFTFPRERLCIFVHGCFWHGCPECYRKPKSNTKYWSEKILTNLARDRRSIRRLRNAYYSVLVLWECKLGLRENIAKKVTKALSRTMILPE